MNTTNNKAETANGAAGSETKFFQCNPNGGTLFSVNPEASVTDMLEAASCFLSVVRTLASYDGPCLGSS